MTTLVRVPDQFTEGAGVAAVHAAATPTCCCCCCCVGSAVTTSAVLAEGLRSDQRAAERRNIVAVVLITLGPLIAITPFSISVFANASRLGEVIDSHFGVVKLIAVLVGIGWTMAVAAAARVRWPVSLGRFLFGVVLFAIEFGVVLFTLLSAEPVVIFLLPLIVFCVHQRYKSRRADRG